MQRVSDHPHATARLKSIPFITIHLLRHQHEIYRHCQHVYMLYPSQTTDDPDVHNHAEGHAHHPTDTRRRELVEQFSLWCLCCFLLVVFWMSVSCSISCRMCFSWWSAWSGPRACDMDEILCRANTWWSPPWSRVSRFEHTIKEFWMFDKTNSFLARVQSALADILKTW